MNTITLKDIKSKGSKAISDDKVNFLLVNSTVKSAILPIREYQMLVEGLEELEDINDIKKRRNEKTITFEKAVAEIENV